MLNKDRLCPPRACESALRLGEAGPGLPPADASSPGSRDQVSAQPPRLRLQSPRTRPSGVPARRPRAPQGSQPTRGPALLGGGPGETPMEELLLGQASPAQSGPGQGLGAVRGWGGREPSAGG